MKIRFKKYHENAVIPKKSHISDACYDVVATSKKDLGDGRIEYGLGFGLQGPDIGEKDIPFQFDIRARSSIHKTGMILSNGIGTGDWNYTGEYKAVFYKIIKELPDYEVGDRIAQIQVSTNINVNFEVVEDFAETDRGSGGFGSTGN